jgi:hypothetical protein
MRKKQHSILIKLYFQQNQKVENKILTVKLDGIMPFSLYKNIRKSLSQKKSQNNPVEYYQ